MKTISSETYTKSTASLQSQVEKELNCTGLEVSIASLLENDSDDKIDKLKNKKGKKNEDTQRND